MGESLDTLFRVLGGLLQEEGFCLGQMEYLMEVIHDPIAQSCGADLQFSALAPSLGVGSGGSGGVGSLRQGVAHPNSHSGFGPLFAPPSPLSSSQRKKPIVQQHHTHPSHRPPAAPSTPKRPLGTPPPPAPHVPLLLPFVVYWDLFANLPLLYQAQRQLHCHHESLCHTLASWRRRPSTCKMGSMGGPHHGSEHGIHSTGPFNQNNASCPELALPSGMTASSGEAAGPEKVSPQMLSTSAVSLHLPPQPQSLSMHRRGHSLSSLQPFSAVEDSKRKHHRRRDHSLPPGALRTASVPTSPEAGSGGASAPRSSKLHSRQNSILSFFRRGSGSLNNSPKKGGKKGGGGKSPNPCGEQDPTGDTQLLPPSPQISAFLGMGSSATDKGASTINASAASIMSTARRNVAELIVDFYTSDEMKQFMLEHFMYADHFVRHVTQRLVDMRRLWHKAYATPTAMAAAAAAARTHAHAAPATSSAPGSPAPSLARSPPTVSGGGVRAPLSPGTPAGGHPPNWLHLTKQERVEFKRCAEFFHFLRRVLGDTGHPTDPRVKKIHYPEGCPQSPALHSNSAGAGDASVRWEGFDTLLVLLSTPLNSLSRYLFRARILLETKALQVSSPAAAKRLQEGFIDIAAARLSGAYAAVMDTISRRDVEMILSHFDPAAATPESGGGNSSSGGFLGRYKTAPLTSNTFCTTQVQLVQLVEKFIQHEVIAADAGQALITSAATNASGGRGSGKLLAATSSHSFPMFQLWSQLKKCASRSLLLYGGLTVVLLPPASNSKKPKTISRLIFLFSDSLVCAEEMRTGRLRLESFFLLRGAKVRTLSTAAAPVVPTLPQRQSPFSLLAGEVPVKESPASPVGLQHSKQLSPFPNAFLLHSPATNNAELLLVADTPEERHYWVKALQKAIHYQPTLQQRREEAYRSGEPVIRIPISLSPLPWSSRLARQRRDDASLQHTMQQVSEQQQQGGGGGGSTFFGTPDGGATKGGSICGGRVGNSSVTSTTVLSRMGGSLVGTQPGPPPPSSYIKREVSGNNWAILGSVHGRMGSLHASPLLKEQQRSEDEDEDEEDENGQTSVEAGRSQQQQKETVEGGGAKEEGKRKGLTPTASTVRAYSRMSSLRRAGLDGSVPLSPTNVAPSIVEDEDEEEDGQRQQQDKKKGEEARASVSSIPEGLETVLAPQHQQGNSMDSHHPSAEEGGEGEGEGGSSVTSSREPSPSPLHSVNVWHTGASGQRAASSSSSSNASSSSDSASPARMVVPSVISGRGAQEGYFGQPMSAFHRSKQRQRTDGPSAGASYRRSSPMRPSSSVTPTSSVGHQPPVSGKR